MAERPNADARVANVSRAIAQINLNEVIAEQRAAFTKALPEPLTMRRDRLRRAASMIRDNADLFCDAVSDDFCHRSREQTLFTDLAGSTASIAHALKHLDRWTRPQRRRVQFPLGLLGAKAWVEYQPLGVVGVISPWNFPIGLVMGPLAGIFAAGNRAMVKTSEFTPATAALFEEVAPRYFARDELAFVSGGADVGRAFAGLSFDHLLFTGATSVGRHILHAAADNLTPVTLELGGKSPAIIGSGADISEATERVVTGKLLNAGQVCLAPDYLLTPGALEAAVVEGIKRAASSLYRSLLTNPDYTAIVNERHYQRLNDLVDDARRKGAVIEIVNPAGEDFSGSNARKMPLHIIRGATRNMEIMNTEIFGPLLPIVTYESINEAVEYINYGERPLALYYFGNDAAEERYVLNRTHSGGVTLNDTLFHNVIETLPFGGIGASGMGNYHGHDGFLTFSHSRALYRQARVDVAKLAGLKPPYGSRTRTSIARELRKGK